MKKRLMKDYRSSKYCPSLNNIINKKEVLRREIVENGPSRKDMHTYISANKKKYEKDYKNLFMKIYNDKCSYCGVSLDIIPDRTFFEVDHFIHKKSKKFNTKKNAGKIGNLVLACRNCNKNKHEFNINEGEVEVHPDGNNIKTVFYRDSSYYIQISEKFINNNYVENFYNKLRLGDELRRIDFLLLSLLGFQEKYKNYASLYRDIGEIIKILKKKRST